VLSSVLALELGCLAVDLSRASVRVSLGQMSANRRRIAGGDGLTFRLALVRRRPELALTRPRFSRPSLGDQP
jgi:hypothetical protein